ncbi:MAG: hercynine metabolism small protein [Cyanobium sp.]|jgi:hercynine metabolism small protein
MGREEQRQAMRATREHLIDELEALYRRAFDRISEQSLSEGAIARLTQLLLRSREAAITPLQEEIEAPLITSAPSPSGASAGPALEAPGASEP